MVKKQYQWANGAKLDDHSKRKHKILGEYVYDYLTVRCRLRQQERFRLAIIDGFSGSGRYGCGALGSPLIFIKELKRATEAINTQRAVQGLGLIDVECLFIFNDLDRDAINLLQANVAPIYADIQSKYPKFHIKVVYLNDNFETAHPEIKKYLEQGRYRNVIFNLDQCGHSHVERNTIIDIMRSYPSAEIFYTFVISALLAFLQKAQPERLRAQLCYLGLADAAIEKLDSIMSNGAWLGTAERIVFEAFHNCAPYVSPFSINNPDGWRYWMIHFANAYRARQVYNNILHANASLQAHFGRSGLNMLSYDPDHDAGGLYLFDGDGRLSAKTQLLEDIPRLVMGAGDNMPMIKFYENIYNDTPAHANDIHTAIIENPDLEVVTPLGGERRKANTIGVNDIIKIKNQRSFFPMFFNQSRIFKNVKK